MTDKQIQTVQNPFSESKQVQEYGSLGGRSNTQAIVAREVAEVQAALTIAQKFPRDQVQCAEQVLQDCMVTGLAEKATYQYARGGTDIIGPSIRLAEALARRWRNFESGIREVERGDGFSICEAYAWDMESNVRERRSYTVRHFRDTKSGGYALTDERDITELILNQGARRKRACMLALLPKELVDAALKQCDTTLATKWSVTPERLKSMLEAFAEYGVTKEMIEARIQRRYDAITAPLLVNLGRIYNSLKDGMGAPGDYFDMSMAPQPDLSTGEKAAALNQKLKEKAGGKGKAQEATQKPAEDASAGPNAKPKPDKVKAVKQAQEMIDAQKIPEEAVHALRQLLAQQDQMDESGLAMQFGVEHLEDIPADKTTAAFEKIEAALPE